VPPLLFCSAQTHTSHRRQHPDTDVVVVKVPAAQLDTAAGWTVSGADPVGEPAQAGEREAE